MSTTALIVGAGNGLSASLGRLFAKQGFSVALAARQIEKLTAIQPVPESAGVAAAVVGFLQMLSGAVASGLVAFLYDGKTAIAMSSLMAIFAIASLAAYIALARPAERRLDLKLSK